MAATPDRDSDARQLRLLRWRAAGHSLVDLALRFDISRTQVGRLTDQVLRDDIEHSTTTDPVASREPEALVRAAYWRTGSGRRRSHAG